MLTLTSSRLARVTAKWRGFCPNTALHSTLDLLSMRVFTASSVSYQLAKCNGESDLFSVVAVTLGSVWERRKYRIRKTLSVFCLLYRQPLSFSARVRKKEKKNQRKIILMLACSGGLWVWMMCITPRAPRGTLTSSFVFAVFFLNSRGGLCLKEGTARSLSA